MKRIVLFVFLLICKIVVPAQDKGINKELGSFVSMAISLRQTERTKMSAAQKKVSVELAKKTNWTVFSYNDRIGGECFLVRNASFRLNTVLNEIHGKRYGKSRMPDDGYLNAEDSKFDYFLIEKGIKAKAKVKYEFDGRVGQQDIVLVPYNAAKADLKVKLTKAKGGLKVAQQKGKDGIICLHATGKLAATDKLILEIENKSNEKSAVVIINYNSRK